MFIQSQNEAFASHAQSTDLTYQCLGGNKYQINLSFYRDCAGVAAPNTTSINIASASCNQNFNVTLSQITGTGIEVSPICSQVTTQCSGGIYPGVQEYKYTGTITLPAQCSDWIFSFSLCCRNAAIGTILNPSIENIYVEAHLNNLNYSCNNSPTFSNAPVPFVCAGQPYCFNNGSSDIDGDSLSYTLITPKTSANTQVTYTAPYSAIQPLASSPAITFNTATGDMCMFPTQLQVTVFAILVEEWRNGILIGSVMRDIQLRTISCTNNNPYTTGINGTGKFSLTACAGLPINFSIPTFDIDASQNVTIKLNNGIAGASFSVLGTSRQMGVFTWIPTTADISNLSHNFTVTIQDNNCPFNGSQIYSFSIIVTGITISTTSTDANCGASNGTATVQIIYGIGPYIYQWLPNVGNKGFQNGLQAGTYTINVTSAVGCIATSTTSIGSGSAPGNVLMSSSNVSCFAGSDGTATANANGGTQPYSYLWSNGETTATATNLQSGTYNVMVTTANGCTTTASVAIAEPATAMSFSASQINLLCNGQNNGSASIVISGGTAPFTYAWNTTPVETSATINNLNAGNYSVIVTDKKGCSVNSNFTITEPSALIANTSVLKNVSCNGLSDGSASVVVAGGTGTYNYTWNTNPIQNNQTTTNLSQGNYVVTITDANNCIATSSVTITQPTVLTVSANGTAVSCYGVCDGKAFANVGGGTSPYIYNWLPAGFNNSSINNLCAGTYSIIVTDANGCTKNSTFAITSPTPIITSATGSTTICFGSSATISASATGGNGGYIYNWNGVGAGATQNVNPSVATTYSVIATDVNGCFGNMATVAINVTSLTAANLQVNGATTICAGNSAMISSLVSGNTGTVTINWSNGLGAGNGPFTVAPTVSTTYTVTVVDACNNSITGVVPIVVNPLPIINIAPQTATSCKEVVLNFYDSSTTNAGAQYNWSFGDGFTSTQANPVHTYTSSGFYNVNVIVTSVYGCKNNASTTCNLTVLPSSTADFRSEAMDGTTTSPIYNFSNTSSNSISYTWNFGDGTSSSQTNPSHTYTDKGTYLVTLYTISSGGCKDSAQQVVEIKPIFTIFIPNAFTPDGNGINDSFTAKGEEIIEFDMMIFDRWGELIYETKDIEKGWDGRANNGSDVSQLGVYVYKIQVRDFQHRYHNYTGPVTLLASE